MKTAIEEIIDEARANAAQLIDEARRYDVAASDAEIDGNGDPEYLRAQAAGCRAAADELIDKARAL